MGFGAKGENDNLAYIINLVSNFDNFVHFLRLTLSIWFVPLAVSVNWLHFYILRFN